MASRILGVLLFLTAACWTTVNSQSTEPVPKRAYSAARLTGEAPKIDGKITEGVWDAAAWESDFVEWRPDENTPPSQPTSFKILYDDTYLYAAIRCYDSVPSKIERRLGRRDSFEGDRVSIMIDSYHDKRTAFVFTTTAGGVKGEEFVSENGENWDDSWNPIWYTAANMDDQGYTVEMKIPFSQLKFGQAEEQVWGLQVFRTFFRANERSVWQRIPLDAGGLISEFGLLRGLKDIAPQKQLEIQPFVVSQYDSYPAEEGNPFRDGSDFPANVGLDAKIGITNDLTLDLTVNPDFGQVDADPGAIALDGFQIFFQERRPFFIENKNIFDFRFANGNDNLFYSRRIGRSPQGFPAVANGEFADVPNNTTILGAAKFSGKTRDGWSVGLLESVTGKMFAEVAQPDGERRKELVEPLTNYIVGRVQKDFNDRNSYIGGIFTATNRSLTESLEYLRNGAYTGGVDFRHNWKDRQYYVEGNVVMSHVTGSEQAILNTQTSLTHLFQRSDASHVSVDPDRTSLTGTGGKLEAGKQGGGNWRYRAGVNWLSPELELNDVGFLRNADEIQQYAGVNYLFQKPTNWYRQVRIGVEQSSQFDFEGNYNRMMYQLNGNINWANNWWTEVGAAHKPRIFINSFLRGGPRWRYAEENYAFLFFGSDNSKDFNFHMGYVHSDARQDNFSFRRYVLRLFYQPFSAFNMSLITSLNDNPNKTQYVSTTSFNGDPRYIMGEIDQKTLSTALRFNYSINPNLSIQFYGEPFISRGRYKNFNRVTNSLAEDLDERISLYQPAQISLAEGQYLIDEDRDGNTDYSFSNPDFAFVQFRSNLVARWEYIPGSEIFLVWSRGVTGMGDAMDTLGSNLDAQILGQKAENTFLIKATYRFIL